VALLLQLTIFAEGLRKNLEMAKEEEANENEKMRRQERRRLVDSSACFKCKQKAKNLEPYVCFQEGGVGGKGSLVCRECRDKGDHVFHSCSQCSKTLCEKSCAIHSCCNIDVQKSFVRHVFDKDAFSWKSCGTRGEVCCCRCREEDLEEARLCLRWQRTRVLLLRKRLANAVTKCVTTVKGNLPVGTLLCCVRAALMSMSPAI